MTSSSPQITPEGKQKTYKLAPRTSGTLPKRVERLVLKHLHAKANAGKMYAKADEALEAALRQLAGSGDAKRRVIEFGAVYEFSAPVTVDDKIKRTFCINDNFTLPELVKAVKFKRHEVKTWATGPRETKEEGGAL